MIDKSMDSQILAQEQWAIELLARETHTPVAKVQELFLAEFVKLTASARIKSFVPLLTSNCVRAILDAQKAALDSASQYQDSK